MTKKIKKTDLINEIREKTAICLSYQKEFPDKLAEERVSKLDNNPCGDGKYYVNVSLKNGISLTYENPETIKKLGGLKYGSLLTEYNELKNLNSCIIEIDVQTEKYVITKYSTLHELMKALYSKTNEDGTLLCNFAPVKRLFKSNPFCEDIENAKLAGCKKVIYSVGNFGKNAGSEIVKNVIKETQSIYSYNLTKLKSIKETYFKDTIDGLEKKVINFIPEINDYTFYEERRSISEGKIVSFEMKIYDFVEYFEKIKNEILNSKSLRIKSSSTKNISYSKNFTAFNLFKKIIGNESDILFDNSENLFLYKMENQFKTFLQLYNKDDDFTESVKNNKKYLKNMLTFEKVDIILKYIDLKYLQDSYEESDNVASEMIDLIKNSMDDLLIYDIHDDDYKKFESNIKEFIKTYLVFFKNYAPCLKTSNNVKFTQNLNKSIELVIPCFLKNDDVSFFDGISTDNFISSEDEVFASISVKFIIKNEEIQIKHLDPLNMNGYYYIYYKELSETDKKTMKIIKNEINNSDLTETKEILLHKHDNTTYYGFKVDDILKRFSCIKMEYSYHDKQWTNPNTEKFFNVPMAFDENRKPIFFSNDKELATKKLEETNNLFKVASSIAADIKEDNYNLYLQGQPEKVYIDTLNYDPWDDVIDKMNQLCIDINQNASTDKNDYIKFKDQAKIEENPEGGEAEDPIKLCDKIFPLDLFGVTGLLNLDNLLSKFGLKSKVTTHIYNTNGPCNYIQIEKAISSGCGGKPINSITFDDIKRSSLYRTEKSILSQFKKEDLDKFKEEYGKFSGNKKALEQPFEKEVKVGIADGYYFYPAGVFVDFVYSQGMITLKNTILPQSLILFSLASSYNSEGYEGKVRSSYKSAFPFATSLNALPLNIKVFLGYPFKPDLTSIIGGETENIPSENGEETIFYIPDPESIKTLIKELPSGNPVTIRFNVFFKVPILCEYPKCEGKEGKCGLEELLEKPVKLENMVSFDLEKRLAEITTNAKKRAIEKSDAEFKNNIKLIGDSAWNIGKNLMQSTTAINEGLDLLYTLGSSLTPIFDLLPTKCLTDAAGDGKNAICSASRKARDKSAIEENDLSFSHTIKTVEVLAKESCEAVSNHVKESFNTFKSLANAGGELTDSMSNLLNNASLYNLCQRRFGDYVNDSGIAKGLQAGLNAVMEMNISDMMKGVLGSCFTNGIIDSVTNSLDSLDESAKNEVTQLLNYGDENSLLELGKKYPEMIDKFGNGTGGLDLESIYSKVGFNTSLLTNLQDEIIKRMNPMSMATSMVKDMLSPDNLINFAKSGVTSLLKEGPTGLGSSIMNNIKGLGLDSINGQIGADITTLLSTDEASTGEAVSNTVLDGMHAYILEKQNLMKEFS